MKAKLLITALTVASLFTGCAINQKSQETTMLTNKEKVVQLLNSIENGAKEPVGYINPNRYIQHNLMVKDGLAGFGELMSQLPKGGEKVEVQRAFEDGNYVFTHTKYDFFGPKAGFDIFRFEDGKIVEHWDNLQEIVEETASGRTMFDGPTEVKDIEKTQENKTFVKNFIEDILMGKNPSKITEYISTETYHQHNPYVKDGLDGLGEAIEYLTSQNDMFIYHKTHFVLGEGNFVLAASVGSWHGKAHAFYDLFRVEDGKIVEHWDTIEQILPKEQWQNSNGKF